MNLTRREGFLGAAAAFATPALGADLEVYLPPVPRVGFKGQRVKVPPLPTTEVRQRFLINEGQDWRLGHRNPVAFKIDGADPSGYSLDDRRGILTVKKSGLAIVSYSAVAQRYDAFGAKGYVVGTPRWLDPEEWAASGDLYRIYVTRFGAEVIPVHDFVGGVRRTELAAHKARVAAKRALLGSVLGRPGLRVLAYGHSVQAVGRLSAGMINSPNGPDRDIADYFLRSPGDTRARFEGAGGHVREGYVYRLLDRLRDPTYLNLAIPGTSSGGGFSIDKGVPYWNGGNALRLMSALGQKPDLVIVDFGLNDIGASDLVGRYTTILDKFRKAGVARIVMTPSGENPLYRDRLKAVDEVRASIAKAAAATASALVDVGPLYRPGNEGAMGLSRQSHAAADLKNHPGRTELRAIGARLAELV